jgi:hypothetical protein
MTVLRVETFSGECPRLPAHLLPENAAQLAINCDFAHGELRSLRGPGAMKPACAAVRSVFQPVAGRMMTWAKATRAWRGTTIDDIYGRVYFENEDGFFVTTETNAPLEEDACVPVQSWRVGLPVPDADMLTVSPGGLMNVTVDGITLVWEGNDGLLGSAPVTQVTTVEAGRRYTVTYPRDSSDAQGVFSAPGTSAMVQGVEYVQETMLDAHAYFGANVVGDVNNILTAWVPYGRANTLARLGVMPFYYDTVGSHSARTAPPYGVHSIYYVGGHDTYDTPGSDATNTVPFTWVQVHDYYLRASHKLPYIDATAEQQAFATPFPLVWLGGNCFYSEYYELGYSPDRMPNTHIYVRKGIWRITVANVLRIKIDGAWREISDVIGKAAVTTNRRVPVVSGSFQGDPFTVYGVGSAGQSSRSDIQVTYADDGNGTMQAYISYGSSASDFSAASSYVVTFVNDWMEESAPSNPQMVERDAASSAEITARYTGFVNGRPIVGMNVYRTYGTSSTYMLVNTTPITPKSSGVWAYTDTTTVPVTTSALGTLDWEPPVSGMKNLTFAGNGFFVACKGKDIWMSEPYHPHAWPYAVTLPHDVVSLTPVDGGVLATTKGQPVILYGTHPAQIASQTITADQSGLSQRATARVAGSALYASNDGIVSLSGGKADLSVSRDLFMRQDWRDWFRNDFDGLVMGEHDGALVGIFDKTNASAPNFVLRLDENTGAFTRLQLPKKPIGLSVLPEADDLVFGFADNCYAEAFGGAPLPLVWHSKDFVHPRPVSFGRAVLLVDGDFVFRLYRDGDEVFSAPVSSGETALVLPATPSHKRWSFRIEGTGTVTKVEVGANAAELQGA